MKEVPSKFVSKMSHDLKTPVGNAMMYAELLIEDLEALASDHPDLSDNLDPLASYCRNVHLSSLKLIYAIKSWSYCYHLQDDVFTLDKSEIDLQSLMQKVMDRNSILIKGKSLDVTMQYESSVRKMMASAEIVDMIMDNMLGFLITLTGSGKAIGIEITDAEGGQVKIRFIAEPPAFKEALIDNYCGDYKLADKCIPEQGVLKPAGFPLIFNNLVLRYMNADHGVDPEDHPSRSFWLNLPVS